MKKLISAVTSLCMAATMVSAVVPASVGAADASKGFAVKTFDVNKPASADAKSSITLDKQKDFTANGYTLPSALYFSEGTENTTTSFLVHLTTDSPDITFKVYEPDQPYTATEKDYTLKSGTATTDCYVSFGGSYDDFDGYLSAGLYKFGVDTSQTAAGTNNAFLGCSWMNMGVDYAWAGEKSDSFPAYVFDTIIPASIPVGTYKITYCKYDTDPDPDNTVMAPMIESKFNGQKVKYDVASGNLTLEEMTITITDGDTPPQTTTTVTTVQQTTTTTKVETPVGDKDFNFTFADSTGATAINAAAGDTITVNANVNAGSNTCAGMDVQFDTGALEITKIGASSKACSNAKVSSNPTDKRANFTSTDTNGDPVAVTNGAAAFSFQVKIPDNAAAGTTYKVGFADGECKVFKEGGTGDKYSAGFTYLTITVGGGTTQTVSQTNPNVSTTTTQGQVVQNGEFKFTFADANGSSAINADAGATVNVNVNVDAGSNKCAGMDVQFDTGALEITKIGAKSAACANAKVSSNPADKRANFTSTDTDGEPVAVTSGAAAFAFQVQIPSDAANGTVYKIGFADGECKVFKEGGTGDKYTTSFAPLTITVGDGPIDSTTSSATTTSNNVTTTTVVQNGEFKFTFADANGSSAINVDAGATVNVNVNVDAGSNKCAGMDVQFNTGALEITKIGAKSAACANAKVSSNPADKRANFTSTDTDGEPVAVTSGAAAFAFQVQIPADAAKGTKYTIGFADGECKVFKEGGTGDKYTTSFAPLVITVGEEDTTTSATTTTVTTTTTTVTTTTVTSTSVVTTTTNDDPSQKLAPTWGDVNCDGVVNVADVVVLNRFLNDPTYPVTAQGKVNGDVKDPQDKSGTAVDPAGVQLTAADSETILKAIVELVTLPQ